MPRRSDALGGCGELIEKCTPIATRNDRPTPKTIAMTESQYVDRIVRIRIHS